ncbi:capsid assembly scaffolding protein Gp46 family protein [Loigolactobacillus coryniformis]|uniref:capsid assembly scaffolding protein Gp46 family protein n=1 Tax=Loigolactobacillus coryniformis TaxID=1610 RepID=UPI001C5ECFD5|nr:DUF4355 domain-containing protein [Loigolactobacillus coryniformis]MBW4802884.1 DUF4355 domain-containing protein [Loigolactobacillus coryniformis subsp. torquens]MBW4805574.1 DUF4355 domain-containing protein [Loigolactobacillus coryniformis subsp. torquens]
MKKNLITLQAPLKLNLQLFADDGDGGNGDAGDGAGDSGNQNSNGAGRTDPPADPDKPNPDAVSFKSQAELDELISNKLNEAKSAWEKDKQTQKAYEDMSPAEKQTYDLKQAQDQLAQTKLENTKLVNKAKLSERLATDQLPGNLIGVFDDVLGAEDNDIEQAYTKITTIFRDAVKSGVDQRLAGSAGKPGAGGTGVENLSAGETAAKARNEQHTTVIDPWKTK